MNKTSFKNFFRLILISLLIVICSAFVGYLLMIFAYSLSTSIIEKNVIKSAMLIKDEGTYFDLTKNASSHIDNFTDAIMLLEASNENKNVFVDSLLNSRKILSDKNPYETLIGIYVDGQDATQHTTYSRYWHGYHLFLKPLLCVFNIKQIRIINFICQIFITFFVLFMLYINKKEKFIVSYILLYLMMMPFALATNFQLSSCFYCMSIGMIGMNMPFCQKKQNIYYLFVVIGILTAFFDFLTYPIVTIGIPLVLYVNSRKYNEFNSAIKDICSIIMFWCIGYVGMWASKWILATIITDENVIINGFFRVFERTAKTGMAGEKLNFIIVFLKQVKKFIYTPIIYVFLSIFLIHISCILNNIRSKHIFNNQLIVLALSNMILCLFPVVWCAFATNHSEIHQGFTNKMISVAFFSIMCYFVNVINRIKHYEEK